MGFSSVTVELKLPAESLGVSRNPRSDSHWLSFGQLTAPNKACLGRLAGQAGAGALPCVRGGARPPSPTGRRSGTGGPPERKDLGTRGEQQRSGPPQAGPSRAEGQKGSHTCTGVRWRGNLAFLGGHHGPLQLPRHNEEQ